MREEFIVVYFKKGYKMNVRKRLVIMVILMVSTISLFAPRTTKETKNIESLKEIIIEHKKKIEDVKNC